jgi:hypothetical protein
MAGTARSGIVMTTISPLRAASSAVTAVAPTSDARSRSVCGPREFAIAIWWPSCASLLASASPIMPAPIIPTFIRTSYPPM